jgi:tetratricopeptide (TPR) repeat protein
MVDMLRLAVLSLLALFTATSGVIQVRSSSGPTGVSSQTADPKAVTLTPQEVFKHVSPSVFIVEALDSGGKVVAFGSGVAVAADQVVTNHHVVTEGLTVRVRRGQTKWPAKVTHDSAEHDLCRLQVEGLKAVAVQVRKSSTLEVGQRVYAIGAPEGLELTFSEGVVSALRDFSDGRIIQTTAPISSGSSGGGLFDTLGRLVGITSARIIEGQNLNFAVPGEWVLALEQSPALASPVVQSGEAARQALEWAVRCTELKGEAAVEACKKAIRLKPDYAVAWFNLGVTSGKLGQWQQALEAYKETIRLKWDHAEKAWYNLGTTYVKDLGQLQQALEAFKEAIRLKPDYAEAWNNLGTTYAILGQPQQALEAYKETIRLKPDDAEVWHGLGLAYMLLEQEQQALEAYKEAIRLKPDYARAWYSLGAVYWLLGNRAKVMEVYQQLKALDPDRAQNFFNKYVLPQ